AGQMMFTKYMVVVSGEINIRDYTALINHILENSDFSQDLLFSNGPLDVLDHSSDSFSFGGKVGLDATIKHTEELTRKNHSAKSIDPDIKVDFLDNKLINDYNFNLVREKIPVLIISVNCFKDSDVIEKVKNLFKKNDPDGNFKLIIIVDHTVAVNDLFMVAWQVLGNSDPRRDHEYISPHSILLDGTIKAFRKGGFPRKWPNIVISSDETVSAVDNKWDILGIGDLVTSPSSGYLSLCRSGKDEIVID
ncbi:MAG TPA: hypothetical protein VFE71_00150, partial [Bacteroidales bacterium]|nr:hypothetical protein [Bacteroidales bacterium]